MIKLSLVNETRGIEGLGESDEAGVRRESESRKRAIVVGLRRRNVASFAWHREPTVWARGFQMRWD